MKKITPIISLLLIPLSAFILFSCEKDLYENQIIQHDIYKKKISFEELKAHHPLAFSKYEKIDVNCKQTLANKQNMKGKYVYDSKFNFYINTDNIMYLEKEDYKSYTFSIKRDNKKNYLENLVLSFNNLIQCKANIVKYNLNIEDLDKLKKDEVIANLLSKTDIENLDEIKVIQSGIANKQLYIDADGNCYMINHVWQSGNIIYYDIIYVDCDSNSGGGNGGGGETSDGTTISGNPWYGSSSGNSNNGNGNNNGDNGINTNGGENGNGNNNPDYQPNNPNPTGPVNPHTGLITIPVEIFEDDETPNPCDLLKSLTDSTGVITGLNFLKDKVNGSIEYGYEIERNINPINGDPILASNFVAGVENRVNLRYGVNIIGGMHNHVKDGQSIPSWQDIRCLMTSATSDRYRRNQGYNVSITVVSVPNNPSVPANIYAITIDDLSKLIQEVNNVWNNSKFIHLNSEINKVERILKYYSENFADVETSAEGMEVRFLGLYRNYGISMYKFNHSSNKWELLTLHSPYNPDKPIQNNYTDKTSCN